MKKLKPIQTSPSYGEIIHGEAVEEVVSLSESDPFSDRFSPKCGDTVKDITNYLLYRQQQFYKVTILEQFDFFVLCRHCKLLLKKYSPLDIKRGIAIGILHSDLPFSYKFVEGRILWLKDTLKQE